MKILFASSEATPFAQSGGLGEVAGALPKALVEKGEDVRVVLPLYECIKEEQRKDMKFLFHFDVPVAWRSQYCGVFEAKANGVTYYLLDNEYYFKRSGLYGYYDDAERFTFFSRAVLELVAWLDGFKPDVIHCNDWQTALIPIYYNCFYANRKGYENIRTVYTIHNIQYQGVYGYELLNEVIGISPPDYSLIDFDGCVNFSKSAIECCNKVTTVSPSYANEILDPWFSHGLDTILWKSYWKLTGILNGIDVDSYNPKTDKAIAYHYSASSKANKAKCKEALEDRFGFEHKPDVPIIALISRLVSHKGLDLIINMVDELLDTTEVRFIVLGTGDTEYEDFFKGLAVRHPDKFRLELKFDSALSRQIYAGADMFLMPSKSEPCGLSQMIALRYGTIPIVRETGGLRDSISDCGDGKGNGFTFKTYNAQDMHWAINRAIDLYYNDKKKWSALVTRALKCDNSWAKSADLYINMYKEACS
ncbi:MAG: glycogen synthase GlgA [Clostridia bacterium]|nr:glycogen synthase GlgA [Candidatus Limimonas egerieequi]MCQ2489669.1 glycogen synthase GlgA [Clostridia bacterium]